MITSYENNRIIFRCTQTRQKIPIYFYRDLISRRIFSSYLTLQSALTSSKFSRLNNTGRAYRWSESAVRKGLFIAAQFCQLRKLHNSQSNHFKTRFLSSFSQPRTSKCFSRSSKIFACRSSSFNCERKQKSGSRNFKNWQTIWDFFFTCLKLIEKNLWVIY